VERSILRLALFVVVAAFVVGCTHDDKSGGGNGNGNSLEDDYLTTVADMTEALDWYAGVSDPAGTLGNYHDRQDRDLDRLAALYDEMRDQCGHFADCSPGGGMSGHRDGDCMSGGHMMGPDDMDMMHDDWQACRDAMDQYWDRCGEDYGDGCPGYRQDHMDAMGSCLDRMGGHCRDWWNGDDDMMDDDDSDHWDDDTG
jgi:hypothetical protein